MTSDIHIADTNIQNVNINYGIFELIDGYDTFRNFSFT